MPGEKVAPITSAVEHDDATYLDFVEGMRSFSSKQVDPVMRDRYSDVAAEFAARFGRQPATLAEAKQVLDAEPIFQTRKRLYRTTQEMNWSGVVETYRKREAELIRELDKAARRGPGRLVLDPSIQYPAYFADYEFHIQPGSYHDDPLAGYIYHYGTSIFYLGSNPHGERQQALVDAGAAAAGRPGRSGPRRGLLDWVEHALAWKKRCPAAEVWGIDLSGPMVRYAHKLAVDSGIDVNYSQMAAENLKFPDNHFDVVYVYILFHEVPVGVGRQIVREAFRVLRPGGIFTMYDFANR